MIFGFILKTYLFLIFCDKLVSLIGEKMESHLIYKIMIKRGTIGYEKSNIFQDVRNGKRLHYQFKIHKRDLKPQSRSQRLRMLDSPPSHPSDIHLNQKSTSLIQNNNEMLQNNTNTNGNSSSLDPTFIQRRQIMINDPIQGGISYLPTFSMYAGSQGFGGPGVRNSNPLTGGYMLNPYVMNNGMMPLNSPFYNNNVMLANANTGIGLIPGISNMAFGNNNNLLNSNFANPAAMMLGGTGTLPFINPALNPLAYNAFNSLLAMRSNPINQLAFTNAGLRYNNMAFYNNIPFSPGGTSFAPSVGNSLANLEFAGNRIAASQGIGGGGIRNFGYGSVGLAPLRYFPPSIPTGYGAGVGLGYNYGNIG